MSNCAVSCHVTLRCVVSFALRFVALCRVAFALRFAISGSGGETVRPSGYTDSFHILDCVVLRCVAVSLRCVVLRCLLLRGDALRSVARFCVALRCYF